jgi:hypothetical protein
MSDLVTGQEPDDEDEDEDSSQESEESDEKIDCTTALVELTDMVGAASLLGAPTAKVMSDPRAADLPRPRVVGPQVFNVVSRTRIYTQEECRTSMPGPIHAGDRRNPWQPPMITWRQPPGMAIQVKKVIPAAKAFTYDFQVYLAGDAAGNSAQLAVIEGHFDLREAIESPNFGLCSFQCTRDVFEPHDYPSMRRHRELAMRMRKTQFDGLIDVSILIRRDLRRLLGRAATALPALMLDTIADYASVEDYHLVCSQAYGIVPCGEEDPFYDPEFHGQWKNAFMYASPVSLLYNHKT